jgi:DNA-binding transcriptional MerR regulator
MKRTPYHERGAWIDPATLFTRQEIAERTGLSDDVLSFWAKRNLLVPAEGGEGKGSHRRYTFPQINIALVYAVFRDHFGANINTLTSLGDLLQRSVKRFEGAKIHVGDWSTAAGIAQRLHDFRTGKDVMVRARDYDEPGYDKLPLDERMRNRPATTEVEAIADSLGHTETSPVELLRFAEAIGPGHHQEARVAQAIIGSLLTPTYMGDMTWLMRPTDDGWDIREGGEDMNFGDIFLDGPDAFGPALFVPIVPMIRKAWNVPHYSMLRRITQGREMAAKLADFGIDAEITPEEDEEQGFAINVKRGSWKEVQRILGREGFTIPDKPDGG